mgnify:CR=1 FL=1
MMFFYVRLKKLQKGSFTFLIRSCVESIEFNSTKEKEMTNFSKFYKQVDKELSKQYGIELVRQKHHRVYKGEVNQRHIRFVFSISPKSSGYEHIILKNINEELRKCGVEEEFHIGKSRHTQRRSKH